MTVKLDISKLKKDGKKLYPTLLYGVTTILNRHEEFRTALDKNGQVGVFSEMLPCYTIFHKETETFSSIWTEFTADYTEFLQNYQKDIDAYHRASEGADHFAGAAAPAIHTEAAEGGAGAV